MIKTNLNKEWERKLDKLIKDIVIFSIIMFLSLLQCVLLIRKNPDFTDLYFSIEYFGYMFIFIASYVLTLVLSTTHETLVNTKEEFEKHKPKNNI